MPRKKVNVVDDVPHINKETEEPGHINEYDIDNGLPFDNKEIIDKIEDPEEFSQHDKDDGMPMYSEDNDDELDNEIDKEIDSPIPDVDPPKSETPKTQPLTETELENIIGDDNAIIDQEIDQSVIEPDTSAEIVTYGDDPSAIVKEDNDIDDNEDGNTIVEQLEQEKKHRLKLKNLDFLQEYAKGVYRTVDEVADKQGISLQTGKNFINEYIKVVKRAIEDKNYPDDVFAYYNRGVSKEKKLKHHHMDALKEIVRKYSQYNVNATLNKRLNNHGNDKFISNNRVASNSSNPLSQFADSGTSSQTSQDSEIKEVRDGITSLQLIKFGLINAFGQAAKMRISAMIGSDPTPYLTDEQRMKNLLIMAGATEHKAQTFIEWLKTHARYVSQPIGFLNYGIPGYNQHQHYGGMGTPGGAPGAYGGAPGGMNGYDSAMTDYYYQQGVYLPGISPDHPENRAALQRYKQEKAQKDQLEAMTRQSEMFMRMQMIKTMSAMGGGDQGSGKSGSLFTPEMLLVTGMGRYERTGIDEQGKPIYGIVPNLGGTPGAYGAPGAPGMGGMPGQPMLGPNGLPINPMDQTSSTLGLVKEIMQTMQMMQQQTQQQNNGEKSFFSEVMGGLAQRVLAPPPQENKLKDFVETFEVISKLNGGGGLMGGSAAGAPPPDPMYMLETQRLQNEKEFGLQALRLKEKDMDMKNNATQRSEGDATKNMQWFVSTMSETLGPLLTGGMQFLFNRGAMGGTPGMGPGGDMAMQPGAGGPGGMNQTALNTIIEMEYAKEERRKKEEAEQKRRTWEEEVRRKEEERNNEIAYQRAMNQAGGVPAQQPEVQVFRPQQPAAGVIQQGPSQYENAFTVEQPRNQAVTAGRNVEEQDITIETFLPHSIDVIQTNIEKATKQKQFLEKYIANAEEAVNEKVASGEPLAQPTDAFGIPLEENQTQSPDNVWDPTVPQEQTGLQSVVQPEEEIPQFIERQENDINEFLQTFPSEALDPDYVGAKEEDIDEKGLKDKEEEEEIDI